MHAQEVLVKDKRRILVADDEPIILMDLAQMLETNDYLIVGTACDGIEAMQIAKAESPDVILMDVKMPLCDGFTAAQNILREQPDICIICCTAFADDAFISQAESIGLAGYVVKPVEERSLLATIEVSFSMSRRLAHNRLQIRETKQKLEERKLIDQACGMLSVEQSINHDQAYEMLQKMAMNRRVTLVKMATFITLCSERSQMTQFKTELMNALLISEQEAWKRISNEAKQKNVSLAVAARQLAYAVKSIK